MLSVIAQHSNSQYMKLLVAQHYMPHEGVTKREHTPARALCTAAQRREYVGKTAQNHNGIVKLLLSPTKRIRDFKYHLRIVPHLFTYAHLTESTVPASRDMSRAKLVASQERIDSVLISGQTNSSNRRSRSHRSRLRCVLVV